jgi:hypothetical protein
VRISTREIPEVPSAEDEEEEERPKKRLKKRLS